MTRRTALGTIKQWLRLGGTEKFELPKTAEAPVRRALIDAAAGAHAREEVESVLRLVVALETRLASPTAAIRLRAWLRDTPELHDLIRALGLYGAKSVDQTRDFLRREGRSMDLGAPQLDSTAPDGAIPLRTLIGGRTLRRVFR